MIRLETCEMWSVKVGNEYLEVLWINWVLYGYRKGWIEISQETLKKKGKDKEKKREKREKKLKLDKRGKGKKGKEEGRVGKERRRNEGKKRRWERGKKGKRDKKKERKEQGIPMKKRKLSEKDKIKN